MKCPSCSADTTLERSIDVSRLVALWKKTGIDTGYLFHAGDLSLMRCTDCGLRFYSPPVPGDDAFYGKLAEWDWYYKHEGKTEYSFAGNYLKSGDSVIDVGCGIGEFSKYVPESCTFLGAELSSKSIEIAHQLGRNVQRIDVIREAQRELRGVFDVVTCFQVLEHVVDPRTFFSALVDMARPGGYLIVAVPNNDRFLKYALNNILNMPPHHVLLWGRSSLERLAEMHNLTIEEYVEERVTSVHVVWYYAVRVYTELLKLLGRAYTPVSLHFVDRALYRVANIVGRILSWVCPTPEKPGHSALVVYRIPAKKPANLQS